MEIKTLTTTTPKIPPRFQSLFAWAAIELKHVQKGNKRVRRWQLAALLDLLAAVEDVIEYEKKEKRQEIVLFKLRKDVHEAIDTAAKRLAEQGDLD